MQWYVHNGHAGPVLVQFELANQQQVELWVNAQSISEGGMIVNEIFNDQEYLKHGVTLQPGSTVVDIGANIGVFGARVLSCVPGGDVRYVGVEPCPQNFKLLQRNLLGTAAAAEHDDGAAAVGQQNSVFHINQQLSGPLKPPAAGRRCAAYPGNIHLVQTAVSSSCGTCSLTYYPHMPGNSTMRPDEKQQLQGAITPPKYLEGAQSLQLPLTTLPQLLKELLITAGPISLLKIDVEGEELEVLRGLDEACWSRIQQVALEVHDCIDPSDELSKDGAVDTRAQADQGPPQLKQLKQQRVPVCQQASGAQRGMGSAHQAVLESLPGPRTGRDIDGHTITYNALPLRKQSGAKPAVGAGCVQRVLPPPRDEGRVMVVSRLLRDRGFRVVMECSLGLLMNYTVYGVKPA